MTAFLHKIEKIGCIILKKFTFTSFWFKIDIFNYISLLTLNSNAENDFMRNGVS